MPKAIVRANARFLSKAKSRSGTAVATPTTPAFDLTKTRADWQAAVAEYEAASGRYVAMCGEVEIAARAADAERSKRLNAVYEEEDRLAVVMDKEDAAATAVLAAPALIEALPLKLSLFQHLWARERRAEQSLDGGDVADVAARIALDLLTLLRRGSLTEIAKAA